MVISSDSFQIVSSFDYKDISIKGIYLNTDKKIPVSIPHNCEIKIIIKGSSSELSLRLRGQIINQTPSGIEVVFDEIDADAYFHLKNILMYNFSGTDSIKEEKT